MNLVILGALGSGKGTQASFLREEKGFAHLDIGKRLRDRAKDSDEIGELIKSKMGEGELIPDEIIAGIVEKFIAESVGKNRVFDGFPRNVEQYNFLGSSLEKVNERIDRVILINLKEDEVIRRVGNRITCMQCGKVYNLQTNKPTVDGKCECGGELRQREDDKFDAIKARLEVFTKSVLPIWEKAKTEGIGREISGNLDIQGVKKEIEDIL